MQDLTPEFQNTEISYNGTTDATLYGTSKRLEYGGAQLVPVPNSNPPKMTRFGQTPHASHDVGMALDLGVRPAMNSSYTSASQAVDPRVALAQLTNSGHYSTQDALTLVGTEQVQSSGVFARDVRTNGIGQDNDQRRAFKDFIALYDITQRGTGSWSNLPLENRTIAGVDKSNDARKALFRDGSQGNGLISFVLIGGGTYDQQGQLSTIAGQNPQRTIRAALDRLGVQNSATAYHHHHYHIYLRPPEVQKIGFDVPKQLNSAAEFSEAAPTVTEASGSASINQDEDENMLYQTMLVTALALTAPAVVLGATGAETNPAQITLTGHCQVVQTPDQTQDNPNAGKPPQPNYLGFGEAVVRYLSKDFALPIDPDKMAFSEARFLELPKYGALKRIPDGLYRGTVFKGVWEYIPNPGYRGLDQFSAAVDVDGKTYKIVMKLVTVGHLADGPYIEKGAAPEYRLANQCEASKVRRIGGNYLRDALPEEWLASAQLSSLLADATTKIVDFLDLPGTAVGTTTGEGLSAQITLDTDAAGHGWYVDATPLDNTDDYLPTSNPNVWQAKAGSAAEGKMDMLSVLLHEYGHALGLDHTADSHDFMAETLQAGQRKLPTAEELQLMANLVAQLKGDAAPDAPGNPTTPPGFPSSIAFAGLLAARRRESGSALLAAQKLISVNPTLQNTEFIAGSTQGWSVDGAVSGNVNGASNTITLLETPTSQTSLMQAFTLGANDRFLSFTVDNSKLNLGSGGHAAPSDAFEVALLDATTYDPLLGNLGLSHSDAVLNLQHNAAGEMVKREASNVHSVTNMDGSTTYTLDLRSLSAGRSVLLSFDLLGFGANNDVNGNSAVTLRNIHMSSAPQAVDDALTVVEDTPTTFSPLANDVDADQPGVVPSIVTGPQHGSVVVNLDGSFTYTPDPDYNGPDSFSYHVGPVNGGTEGVDVSNTATVNIFVRSAA